MQKQDTQTGISDITAFPSCTGRCIFNEGQAEAWWTCCTHRYVVQEAIQHAPAGDGSLKREGSWSEKWGSVWNAQLTSAWWGQQTVNPPILLLSVLFFNAAVGSISRLTGKLTQEQCYNCSSHILECLKQNIKYFKYLSIVIFWQWAILPLCCFSSLLSVSTPRG